MIASMLALRRHDIRPPIDAKPLQSLGRDVSFLQRSLSTVLRSASGGRRD